MSTLSLSVNDATKEHDAIDQEIADWPEEVRAKAPNRTTHPYPETRIAALEALKPHAMRVQALAREREDTEARIRATNEADRLRGQYHLEWESLKGEARNELWGKGVRTEQQYRIYREKGVEGLGEMEQQKDAKYSRDWVGVGASI